MNRKSKKYLLLDYKNLAFISTRPIPLIPVFKYAASWSRERSFMQPPHIPGRSKTKQDSQAHR